MSIRLFVWGRQPGPQDTAGERLLFSVWYALSLQYNKYLLTLYLYLVKKVRRGGDILQFQVYSKGRGTDNNVEKVQMFGVSEVERTQLCLERNKNTKRRVRGKSLEVEPEGNFNLIFNFKIKHIENCSPRLITMNKVFSFRAAEWQLLTTPCNEWKIPVWKNISLYHTSMYMFDFTFHGTK